MRDSRSFIGVMAMGMVAAAAVIGLGAANPPGFMPDGTVKGSTLAGWHAVGDAEWKNVNGELIGTAKPGGSGGWLVMDKGFQDVELYTNYKCVGTCTSGVLLRAQKTADGGLKGVFVSLADGDLGAYNVTVDGQGKVLSRDRIVPPARGGGAGGGGNAPAAGAAPAAGGGGGRAARGGGGGNAPAANAPAGGNAPAAPARAGGGGGGGRGAAPSLKAGDWNPIDILVSVKTLHATPGGNSTVDDASASSYGPIALYAGSGEVHFKDVAWKDLNTIAEEPEKTDARYTALHISNFYYGWSAAVSDITHDGQLDVVAGPFYFTGPKFTQRHIYRDDRIYNPATEYAPDMVNLSADFTGDGWPDILASGMTGGRPMTLYVNPRGENRRWDHFLVLPTISTEIVLMKDLDKDGKPEIIAAGGGVYYWAHPDPANPTAEWTKHPISTAGGQAPPPHGIGVGDVNGDGKLDVVTPFGWYEQPAGGIEATPWTFHSTPFGDNVTFGNGGGEIGVYDINGDGLTDVVMGQAHNWGMYWYEQKKDGSFVQHRIQQDFSTENMGNVTFSESHAERFVDMNGDGIPDMVTGKRYWSHLENYNGEDPYGAPVLVIYKTVRDAKAPGGARFEPEIVHNHSGIGSSFDVADINKDGKPDIVTSGGFGTYIFMSKPTPKAAAAPASAPAKK